MVMSGKISYNLTVGFKVYFTPSFRESRQAWP
jgi:hypothetical protein